MKTHFLVIVFYLTVIAWFGSAAGMTINFKGTVTSTDANAVAITEVGAGDRVSGAYSFDPNAADGQPMEPASGLYDAESFILSVNGFEYISESDNNISVTNNIVPSPGEPALDAYEIVSSLRGVAGPSLSGLPPAQIDIVLVDTDATVFSDDSLPEFVDLDEFEIVSEEPFGTTGGRLVFQSLATGGIGEIRFAVTELTSQTVNSVFYPHIAAAPPWKTEIGIVNTSSSKSLTGSLIAHNAAGLEVSTPINVQLNPNGRAGYLVGQSFSNASQIRYIVLTTESRDVRGYLKFFQPGLFRVAIPAVMEINRGDIYIPHIASGSPWSTGVNLVNTTDSAKNLEIEFSDGQNHILNLQGGAHTALTVQDMLGGPQPGIESAVIRNAAGIIGLEVFLDADANIISGVLLKDDTAAVLDYPHIVGDATWDTALVAQNPNDSNVNMKVHAYSADGNLLGEPNINVDARRQYIGNVRPGAKSLNLPADAAWIQVSADQGLTGFELFITENRMGGYTGVGIRKSRGAFVKLEKDGWTGIALVNPNQARAEVTLQAFDDQGVLKAEADIKVEPFSKVVKAPENLFPTDISDATHIQFSSTEELAAFQLNNSSDDMMLDAIPAL